MARLIAPPRGIITISGLGALAVLGVCALALATAHGGMVYADAQPSIAVTFQAQDSTGTMAVYRTVASGFAAGATITETMGDGTTIAPATGTANASGSVVMWWTLNAATKYCGTLTAKSDTATATASFWVAQASDAQSGTACAAPTSSGSSGTATPAMTTMTATAIANASATAAASASATAAATHTTAPPPATTNTSGGTGQDNSLVSRVLRHVSWPLVALGGGGLLLAALLLLFGRRAFGSASSKAQARRSVPRRLPPEGRGVAGWAGMPTRRGPAQGAVRGPGAGTGMGMGMPSAGRAPVPRPGGADPFSVPPPNQPPRYVPGRTANWPDEPAYRPSAMPPERSQPGGRSGHYPAPPAPKPDIRWSRSHPSAERSRPGAAPARTLRDAPSPGRRPGTPDSSFLQDQ